MQKRMWIVGFLCMIVSSLTASAQEIDLISKAKDANWQNSDLQTLSFSRDQQAAGTVRVDPVLTLEDGKPYSNVLFIHPPWVRNGIMYGFFENITIPENSPKLVLAGGFNQGAQGTDGVQFSVRFMVAGPVSTQTGRRIRKGASPSSYSDVFCTLSARYDGKIDRAECDMSQWAGRTGVLTLMVSTVNTADKDWAVLTEFKIISGEAASPQEEKAKRVLKNLKGHGGRIYSLSFSRDGKLLASASADRTARVWDFASGRQMSTLSGHTAHVFSVDFHPGNRRVVTASGDKTAIIWQAGNGNQIHVLRGHDQAVLCAAFSPDGNLVATGGEDGTVKIWQADNGQEVRAIAIGTPVYCLAFAPQGGTLAVGSTNGNLSLWRVGNGSRVSSFQGHGRAVNSVAFNPGGNRLVSTSVDNNAKLWNVANGNLIRNFGGQSCYAVSFRPQGEYFVTGSDGQAVVWSVPEGRRAMNLRHASGTAVRAVAFAPNGTHVAMGGDDSIIRIWEINLE